MKQSTAFLRGEGDRWYLRNLSKPREPDPVFEVIKELKIKPKRPVLEIGCGDGWRLTIIRRELGSVCYGMDASKEAITNAPDSTSRYGIKCWCGTAEKINLPDNSVDMVIYGFCLYVADREDLFRITAESDRVLRDGGHIVIHDFHPDFTYSRIYEPKPELRSYKQNYGRLWLGNPGYFLVHQQFIGVGDDRTSVVVLKKNLAKGWPLLSGEELNQVA